MARKVATVIAAGVLASEVSSFRGRRENSSSSWSGRLVPGHIDIKNPAFLYLHEDWNEVLVSQFGKSCKPGSLCLNPLPASSSISRISVDKLGSMIDANAFSGSEGTSQGNWVRRSEGLKWPNKLSRTPSEIGDYVVVPDGFLPPTKSNGNIFFAKEDGSIVRVTEQVEGAFYHEVEWHDFNGDGRKDMLTCRTIKGGPFWGPTFRGELLWYENPGDDVFQEWRAHVITDGPDVIFKSIPYQGGLAIFTTEFFNRRISVQLVSTQGDITGSRVIDDNMGKPFAVDYVDLDADGTKELLVTNHQGPDDEILPAVFAYEVPADLLAGEYPRHSLAYGVSECKTTDVGVGAPGFGRAFYPKVGMNGKPYVIAAGDGSFDVWILKPTAERFKYDIQIIDFEGTTGELLMHDFNGDGITDVLVPDNDFWKLQMITFDSGSSRKSSQSVSATGQCTNSDYALMDRIGVNAFAKSMSDCSKQALNWLLQWNAGKFTSCAKKTGLSTGCSGCFEGGGSFAARHCKVCINHCAPSCLNCLENHRSKLETCVGRRVESPTPC